MPAAHDLVRLGQMVAATHGWPAARAFKGYAWMQQDQAIIAACAKDILKLLPKAAGQEDFLNLTLAFQLQRQLDAPVHLVAGTLHVDGVAVRSDRLRPDGVSPFATFEPGMDWPWHGHLWIMVGPHIVDATLFRLANSPDCPPPLARHVHAAFGPDKALYADHWRRSRRTGLHYDPLFVLDEDDVTRLLSQAYRLIADRPS